MQRFMAVVRSSTGEKALVALSGAFLAGWLVLHMIGNLTLFSPDAAADRYAATLRDLGPLLWVVRGALAVALVVHVVAAARLAARARRARPVAHTPRRARESTVASRTLRVGGPLIAAFVVFHVFHLTLGVGVPGFVPLAVHGNLVSGLRSVPVALLYIGAAALVGLHLSHALWSAPKSLGVGVEGGGARRERRLAAWIALVVAGGFAAIPVAVLLGVLR